MSLSLSYRFTTSASLAAGLYWAIREHGLGLPSQAVVAERCGISAATLSRRLRRWPMDELMVLVADARGRSHPPHLRPTWDSWLAADDAERSDAQVWTACLQVALHSPSVGKAVRDVWQRQRAVLAAQLGDGPDSGRIDAVHALIDGLVLRMLLDEDFDHAAASAVLKRVVA
ncbi:hypothetical protein ASG76_00680 [Nocardioides sp. Soil774]|uniref:TetR family transcriptional regulator C-terminal domain-containing protein n=1 Tax=Nocardioides sp. Soil774 TaxID=1736408 RepID=UPI0007012773|nr:TetR family transcriptional regulator C-terminal domain-containing protein [Nocardioides sp. Soil774]KRE97279.1 hypothetical protein ASG76_00680 [Nocardioides sp. Soil774]